MNPSSSTTSAATRAVLPIAVRLPVAALWLVSTALAALAVYYFVGIDQGALSVFGSDTHVHEFIHDSRHLLGFPCH